jgi:amino acid transporter
MIFVFLSSLTHNSSQNELLSSVIVDFSFYLIIAGLIGVALFRKEKGKYISKALLTLMIVAPLLFLIIKLGSW